MSYFPFTGDKHHQRRPGKQSGDGGGGSGPRAGDPEDHRALLPSAGFQRRRPAHQRPGRGADERERQRRSQCLKHFIQATGTHTTRTYVYRRKKHLIPDL